MNCIRKIKNIFFDNPYVVFFSFLILLNPYFLSVNSIINTIFNGVLITLIFIVYFLYFTNFKISRIQIAIFIYFFVSLISTVLGTHDIIFWLKQFLLVSSISLYSELLIRKNINVFLKTVSILLSVFIVINFLSILIFQEGIFKTAVYFLGYDNASVATVLLGTIFIGFTSIYFQNKLTYKFWIIFAFLILTYLIRWSVGPMISCIGILGYFLIVSKNEKLKKYFSLKNIFIFAFILFILVVVFGIQKYFAFIIVNILHKNITLTGRTQIWQRCFQFIYKYPLIGMGMMNFNDRWNFFNIYHAHCNFLNVILETGIIGFGFYVNIWRNVINSFDKNKGTSFHSILILGFLGYLICTTIDVLYDNQMLIIFWNLGFFLPYIIRKQNVDFENRKHVLLFIDSGQPLPSIQGGAIEQLVDYYILENEQSGRYIFDIYSTFNKSLLKSHIQKTQFANYFYINKKTIFYKLKQIIRYLYIKITKKYAASIFTYAILDDICANQKESYYDIVISENSPASILLLKKNLKSSAWVLHVHNDINILNNVNNCIEQYDEIIACSNYINQRIKNLIGNSKEIQTIYNGVNQKELLFYKNEEKKLKVRERLNIKTNDFVFGFCGRLCKDKGVKELILAFKKICVNNPNVKLLIAGSSFFKDSPLTDYISEIREIAAGLENKIIFTGYIDHQYIGEFYSALDVFVLPSIVNEACPLTLIEAQTMGLPIITTKNGGIVELVNKENSIVINRNNLVFELEFAMNTLYQNNDLVSTMAKESLKNSKKFNCYEYTNSFLDRIDIAKRIKIVHLVHALKNGGVEQVIYNYFSHMPDSYDKFIIYKDDSYQECVEKMEKLGFKCYQVKENKYNLKYFLGILKFLRKENYDIIHCHLNAKSYLGLFAGLLCGIKVRIMHCHGEEEIPRNLFKEAHLSLKIYFSKILATQRFSCGIFVGTKLYKDDNFNVIYNAIDINKFRHSEFPYLSQIKKDDIVYGNIARFSYEKNHEFLLDVFSNIKKRQKNAKLLLVGDGDLRQVIINKIMKLHLEDSVILTGFVNDPQKYYKLMNVYIFPSLHEGLPLTLIEAQMSGLPIVMSDSITDEVIISNNVKRLSLKDQKKWIDSCIYLSNNKNHLNREKAKCYNISYQAKVLDYFYKKSIRD